MVGICMLVLDAEHEQLGTCKDLTSRLDLIC